MQILKALSLIMTKIRPINRDKINKPHGSKYRPTDKEAVIKAMIDEIYEQAYDLNKKYYLKKCGKKIYYMGYFDKKACEHAILFWLEMAKIHHIELV
jgi:hypothetical protein